MPRNADTPSPERPRTLPCAVSTMGSTMPATLQGAEHSRQLSRHRRLQLGIGAGRRLAVRAPALEGGGVAEAVPLHVVVGDLADQVGPHRLPRQVAPGVPAAVA